MAMGELEILVQGGAVGLALAVITILGWVLRRMLDREDKLLLAYERNSAAYGDLREVLVRHAGAIDRMRESVDGCPAHQKVERRGRGQ